MGLLDGCCVCLLQTPGRETHCVFCDVVSMLGTLYHIWNENLGVSKVYTCDVHLARLNIHLDNCNDDKVAYLFALRAISSTQLAVKYSVAHYIGNCKFHQNLPFIPSIGQSVPRKDALLLHASFNDCSAALSPLCKLFMLCIGSALVK